MRLRDCVMASPASNDQSTVQFVVQVHLQGGIEQQRVRIIRAAMMERHQVIRSQMPGEVPKQITEEIKTASSASSAALDQDGSRPRARSLKPVCGDSATSSNTFRSSLRKESAHRRRNSTAGR